MLLDRRADDHLLTPDLPPPRGPLSAAVVRLLIDGRPVALDERALAAAEVDDDDLQLALYVLYELHYRGFAGVDPDLEWSPGVLAVRGQLEQRFVDLLHELVAVPPTDADRCGADLQAMLDAFDGPSLSTWVEAHAERWHLQELAVHRSAYQLKEADPHTFAIPRLPAGRAKSALLALQFDEYGNGEPGASHAELFADTMRSLDLDDRYGRYLDRIPGCTLATVNLLSLVALHRRWRGACIGHLAVFEMTSVVPMQRYAAAHRRATGGERGAEFYDVHVEADAEHERIAADTLVPELVAHEPGLAADVLFGAAALLALEDRYARHVLAAWEEGRSSLRPPRLAVLRAATAA